LLEYSVSFGGGREEKVRGGKKEDIKTYSVLIRSRKNLLAEGERGLPTQLMPHSLAEGTEGG